MKAKAFCDTINNNITKSLISLTKIFIYNIIDCKNKNIISRLMCYNKGVNANTFTSPEFSIESFLYQGWTCLMASFYSNNLIHNNILVNEIYEDHDKDN